jgi:Leucine-rich repeat (LRR) protein
LVAWPDLGALTRLRNLQIRNSSGLHNWGFLAALTALSSLFVSSVFFDAGPLASLTQLKVLSLSSVAHLDLDDSDDEEWEEEVWEANWQLRLGSSLASLVSLHFLTVTCIRLETLDWCSALTNLKYLHASYNRFVFLEPLKCCPKLKYLDLSFCHSLTSLEPLLQCPKLSTLILMRHNGAAVLPGLEQLRGLPGLNIIDTEEHEP